MKNLPQYFIDNFKILSNETMKFFLPLSFKGCHYPLISVHLVNLITIINVGSLFKKSYGQ